MYFLSHKPSGASSPLSGNKMGVVAVSIFNSIAKYSLRRKNKSEVLKFKTKL